VVVVLTGCGADHGGGVALVRAQFAKQARHVLAEDRLEAPVALPAGGGFELTAAPAAAPAGPLAPRRGLRARFPEAGGGDVHLSLPDGFAATVHELGRLGPARTEGHALVYDREDGPGASFWSATAAGYEEWLLLEAPADGAAAVWEVHGATLRQQGDAVELLNAAGEPRVRVTAPRAHAATGAPVTVRLAAAGARLTLTVSVVGASPGARQLVLVDPAWTATGSLSVARSWHTATLLPSGQVLVVGGRSTASGPPLASAELYDPATGIATPTTGTLATGRYNHTATLLTTGKVLVVGGQGTSSTALASAELFDPATGLFTRTNGDLPTTSYQHTATLLPSGQVVVIGGRNTVPLKTAVLYDP